MQRCIRASNGMNRVYLFAALSLLIGCSSESRRAEDGAEVAEELSSIALPSSRVAVSPQAVSDSLPASMMIRTGIVSIEVPDLAPAVAATEALITRLGGHIGTKNVQVGESHRREAEIVARVPADRFDEALSGLRPVGDVQGVDVQTQDVGEEYVDIAAQVRNRKLLEERLLNLLATRAGNLEEVLAVERELARVREEIERQEGRLKYLRNRVSFSTLTIRLREPAPVFSTYGGQNVFVDAARSAWRNFIGLIVGFIASLGVLIPLALVGLLAWGGVRRARSRRSARAVS